MVNPQLPPMTVVTPCSGDGDRSGSQNTWASRWVCTSMNPGVTARPVASIVAAASAPPLTRLPMAVIRSPTMPMSARRLGPPRPSITSPPRMSRSNMCPTLAAARPAVGQETSSADRPCLEWRL